MNSSSQRQTQLDLHEARWFAVYTRYKREKRVRDQLREKQIETYLPLQTLTRTYTRKVRTVELPLISCYVFVRITRKDYVRVLETPEVVQFVKFANELIAIPDREIQLMRRVVGQVEDIAVEPLTLLEGDEVEILGGQLTGIRGSLLRKESEKNVVIELHGVGYALHMHVDPARLRKVRPRAASHP